MNETRLLNISEVADRLGLKPVTIRLWASEGKIAKVKLGRAVRIPSSEVERLITVNLIPADERKILTLPDS